MFKSRDNANGKEKPKPSRLESAFFGNDKNEVFARYQRVLGYLFERYKLRGSEGALIDSEITKEPKTANLSIGSSVANQGIQISLKQSLNQAPTLWAFDTHTNKSAELWNPNPQLGRMKLGEASVYRWKDRTRFEWSGALIKPTNYVPGKRYPLVIQTHGFYGEIFKEATDGGYPTAMAARPLANAGVMVLQMPDKPGKDLGTASKQSVTSTDSKAPLNN